MDITKDLLQKHIADLQGRAEKAAILLHSLKGALDLAQHLLLTLDSPPPQQEPQPMTLEQLGMALVKGEIVPVPAEGGEG